MQKKGGNVIKLEDVSSEIISGQNTSRIMAKEVLGEKVIDFIKAIVPKSIVGGRIIYEELQEIKLKETINLSRITKQGDIVIKLSTPYDSVYITKEYEGLLVTSFCIIIKEINNKLVDPRFITAYLNTDYAKEILRAKTPGSVTPLIRVKDVKEIEIPDIELDAQIKLGELYEISCQKQNILKDLLFNEQEIIENIMLETIKRSQLYGKR